MKKFKYRLGEGKYYFNIVSGMQTILVSRKERKAAIVAFQKYLSVGKTCEWLFKNIDEKIEDLRNQKKYHGSLEKTDKAGLALQFSNLFYKMKLLSEFINSN